MLYSQNVKAVLSNHGSPIFIMIEKKLQAHYIEKRIKQKLTSLDTHHAFDELGPYFTTIGN